MKKFVIILAVLISLPIIIFLFFIHLQNTERSWHLKELDDFLQEIRDDHKYIYKSDVAQLHGKVRIRVYYKGHEELVFDESIYEEFKRFFDRDDIQEQILVKMAKDWPNTSVFYPDIKVDFVDTIGLSSHYIKAYNSGPAYDRSGKRIKGFQSWTDPEYYVSP